MNRSKVIITYLDNISLFLIGVFLVLLPILFLSTTTESFYLPKQIALSVTIGLFSLFFAVKTIAEGKLKVRTTPFDMSIGAFIVVAGLSAIFSTNRFDALIAFVPLFFIAILYFGIINLIKNQKQFLFILSCITLGAVLSSLVTILSYLKIYPLPFDYSHVQYFTTFGSLLDQAIYLALILPVTGYFAYAGLSEMRTKKSQATPFTTARLDGKSNLMMTGFSVSFVVIAVSLAITIYSLMTTQKPPILPFETGLQTGFSAISEGAGGIIKNVLLGSGIGTYLTDFTRFKPATYNANPTLWSLVFLRSSSFVLELLATTGLLGLGAFLFLTYKVVKSGTLFVPIALAMVAAYTLPFSFTLIALLFIILGIYSVILIQNNPEKFAESEFYLVALKKGLFVLRPEGEHVNQNDSEKRYSKILPIAFFILVLVAVGTPLFYVGRYVASDLTFKKSLVASRTNGLEIYNLQNQAIQLFPYRDIYHRGFSQTNMALANSLASSQRQSNSSPSAQLQQNISTLIQQSINEGRASVTVSPLTTFNWNGLSSIYRSLIGFGQNADRFTIVTAQQAIALDPNNPQQYVELGGIYLQLKQYDEAIRQFNTAINLKNDYANAYYNLGHALEIKKDLTNALAVYEKVKQLVSKDKASVKKINDEIDVLKKKIASGDTSSTTTTTAENSSLKTNDKPENSLPETDPQVKIPGPSESPTPTPKTSPTPTN